MNNHRHDNPAIGCSQFTPTQQFFIQSIAAGRWASEPAPRVHTAFSVQANTDGTVDMIRLNAGLNGSWRDMGGRGGIDFRAGRC